MCSAAQLCLTLCNPIECRFCSPMECSLQACLSTAFCWQEYWNRLPFPSPGDISDRGFKPMSPLSPALAGGFFNIAPPGKPQIRVDIDTDVLGKQTCHTKMCLFGLKIIFSFVRNKKFRKNF